MTPDTLERNLTSLSENAFSHIHAPLGLAQLVLAKHRRRRRLRILSAAASVIAIAVVGTTVGIALNQQRNPAVLRFGPATQITGPTNGHFLPRQPYPKTWRASLSTIEANARFTLLLPVGSSARLLRAIGDPNGNLVALTYQLPVPKGDTSSGTQRETITITEQPWDQGDPETFLRGQVRSFPAGSAYMCSIDSHPAACVPRYTGNPRTGPNGTTWGDGPNDILYDDHNVRVEVTGGHSIDDLITFGSALTSAHGS